MSTILDQIKDDKENNAKIAEHYFNNKSGILNISQMIDNYWTMVSGKYILPSHVLIYNSLVDKNHNENNYLCIGDADGTAFFIPSEGKKVWVMTNQSIDYIFISTKNSLHIRRLFRKIQDEEYMIDKNDIVDLQSVINNSSSFENYSDDNYEYSKKPSLDYYKDINFEMSYDDTKNKNHHIYGDFRDGGYVMSYYYSEFAIQYSDTHCGRFEGSINSFHHLQSISQCYLGCVAYDLEIELPHIL